MLNDLSHELEKSPKAATFMLTHPPMSEDDKKHIRPQVDHVADKNGEPRIHSQALEIVPTFHADFGKFLYAGGNCIAELKFMRFGKTKDGTKTVTLELPSWWRRGAGGW